MRFTKRVVTYTRMGDNTMSNVQMKTLAETMGCDVNDVEKMMKVLAYRKEYNTRPEVVAKRRVYAKERNLKLSILSKLLKGGE